MKTIKLISTVVLVSFMTACGNNTNTAEENVPQAIPGEVPECEQEELHLHNNEKWKVNEATQVGMTNMKAIIAQKLLKSIKPGVARVPTIECMTFSPVVRKLVLEGDDHKLPDAIRIGAEEGMQDFTMSLKQLIDDELIDRPTAFAVAPNKDALKMALKGIDVRAPGIL